jgi:hypothetical protein
MFAHVHPITWTRKMEFLGQGTDVLSMWTKFLRVHIQIVLVTRMVLIDVGPAIVITVIHRTLGKVPKEPSVA